MDKTISDIAQELNVSVSTVSKVINQRPGVSADQRKRISEYLESVGFRPNALAQSMIRGRTNIIGLIFGDVRNPFYANIMHIIQRQLISKGYMVMAFNSDYCAEKELEFINHAIQHRFAGLFLVTAQNQQLLDAVDEARAANISVVLVNRILQGYNGSFVSSDNFQAGYLAAKHLLELGHRQLGFLAGGMDSSAGHYRYKGFQQAIENYSLTFDEDKQLYTGDLKMETGYQFASEFVKDLHSNPTGIVIGNDLMALGFVDYCKKNNFEIPGQISIVSFDNILYSGLYGMELTTIDQHSDTICTRAVDIMLDQIDHPDNGKIFREMIEPTLIIRKSTARCE